MEKDAKRTVLRVVSVVLAILGVMTMLPCSRAQDFSMCGYKALCPFMPISTILIIYVAATIHRYLENTGRRMS